MTLILATGCASTGQNDPESDSHSGASYGQLNNKQVHAAVMAGGEEAGRKMTPFKRSTIIAEDINEENPEMVTVIFEDGHITYEGEDYGDLEDAIEEQIEKASTPSH
jgi:hypothetical protein